MELYLKLSRPMTKTTRKMSSEVLVKATNHKDKKFHFNQYGRGVKGDPPEGDRHYSHDTHEKMFAWHIPDEGKKAKLRHDAHEQAMNGSTKGHVSAHALMTVLDDFKERLNSTDDEEMVDQIMSEFHDWLMYLHAQHGQHGLDKDPEFRRAYTDAHNFYSMTMADHANDQEMPQSQDDDEDDNIK